MAGSGDGWAAAAGRSQARVSHTAREQVIDVVTAAFVPGRLAQGEFDARIGHALVARSHAELATITADLPAGLAAARPRHEPARMPQRQVNRGVKWGRTG